MTSITERIQATTPLYQIDLTVNLQEVSCPATLSLIAGSMAARTVPVCAAGQTAPSSVHVLQPVFDSLGQLPPDSEVSVAASVNGGTAFRTTIATPTARSGSAWVTPTSAGTIRRPTRLDASSSSIAMAPGNFYKNDASFSWVSSAAPELNARLGVPGEWSMTSHVVGISGAKTSEYERQGQLTAMRDDIETHAGSWNVVSFTGGANDAGLEPALKQYYKGHLDGMPWAVTSWSKKNCPDSDSAYEKAIAASPVIRSTLKKVISTASASSASTRFVDVSYPYVVATGNVCGKNRSTAAGTWYGSNAVVNFLATLHNKLSAPGLVHVDLRSAFDNKGLTHLQLIRYFGYPHPNAEGQALIAQLAAAAVK